MMTSWRSLGFSSCPGDGSLTGKSALEIPPFRKAGLKSLKRKPDRLPLPPCFFSEARLTLVTFTLVRELVSYVRSSGSVFITSGESKLLFVPGTSKS